MDDQRVQRRQIALSAAVMEALHEGRHKVAVAALVQFLRRWEPRCLEDAGVVDRLAAVLSAVPDRVVDSSIHMLVCDVPAPCHVLIRPEDVSPGQGFATRLTEAGSCSRTRLA
jgi:hypothetical protein